MDKNLARKIQDRHRKKNGLIQLWNYQRKKKIESYRHHLVEAGTQYNSKKWK